MNPMAISQEEQNVRNIKDFMQLYNKLTEECFSTCVHSLNQKTLTTEEVSCVSNCADRYLGFNQRFMVTFMQSQSARQDAAIKEMEKMAEKQSTDASQNITVNQSAPGATAATGVQSDTKPS